MTDTPTSDSISTSTPLEQSPKGLLTDAQVYNILRWMVVSRLILSIFGIISNTANIYTFHHMGLKDTVIVVLFVQSAIDQLFLVVCLCFNGTRILLELIILFDALPVMLTSPEPVLLSIYNYRVVAYDLSTVTTVFIAVQRCCCVTFPIRFKHFFSIRKSLCIIFATYILIISLNMPGFLTYGITTVEVPHWNKSMLVTTFNKNADDVRYSMAIVTGTVLPGASTVIVLVCFKILAVNLARSKKFRATAALSNAKTSEATDNKQSQLVKTIFYLSLLFLSINVTRFLGPFLFPFIPTFGMNGRNKNVMYLIAGSLFIFEIVNASCNFFIYFKCNTRFKEIVLKSAVAKLLISHG